MTQENTIISNYKEIKQLIRNEKDSLMGDELQERDN